MTVKISMLWCMWIGGVMYDVVCAWWNFFPNHTASERVFEDIAVASFIVGAWALARLIRLFPHLLGDVSRSSMPKEAGGE
jgi:hypothetical protein